MAGGTGQKFEAATTVIAGVASLAATLLSIVYGAALPIDHVVSRYAYANSLLQQVDMAADVRIRPSYELCSLPAHATLRKNYRKPLLQRYVVRILLMWV